MVIYHIIYILQIFFIYNRKKSIFWSFVILFWIMSFVRWEVGTDWESYYNYFVFGSKSGYVFEKGFEFINIVIRLGTDNYTILLFLLSIPVFLLKYYTIYRYSHLPILTLLANYSLYRGNIFFVRQDIAGAICFFSLKYIIEKRKIKFLILIIIAMLFHKSSVIFIFAYLIYHLNLTKKKMMIILLISLIFSNSIIELINFISLKLNFWEVNYYLSNLNNNFGYEGTFSKQLSIYLNTIIKLMILGVILLFHKLEEDSFLKGIFNLNFLGTILYIIFSSISLTLARFAYYYELFQIFLYFYIVFFVKNKYIQLIFLFVIIVYLFIKLNTGINIYYESYVPYKTIFLK